MSDLRSRTVLLTRAAEANAPLATALRDRGARVVEVPCLRVEHLADAAPLAAAIRALGAADRLVLTSPAGVDAVLRAVRATEVRAPISAVGRATAARLAVAALAADVPSTEDGATLARELPIPQGRVLLARSDRALRDLPDALRERGARVDEVVAYRTVPGVDGDVPDLSRVDVAVFASPSAVDGLLAATRDAVRSARVVAVGPTTAAHAEARLGRACVVAGAPTVAAVLAAIERSLEEVPHAARS